jgi:hypothetical protein
MATQREYTPRQERIITYLEGKTKPTDDRTLAGYLGIPIAPAEMDNLRKDMRVLIKDGLVKSYTVNHGGIRAEAYHLKGRGKVVRGSIQGHSWLERFVGRFTGSILILFGLSFLAYQDFPTTGNVISSSSLVHSDFGFIVGVVSMIIGGFFLIKSFKEERL